MTAILSENSLRTLSNGDYFTSPRPVYIPQFGTHARTDLYLYGKVPTQDDPLWQVSGFATPEEYAYWAPRLCGLNRVKMGLETYGYSRDESLAQLTAKGVEAGGYRVADDAGWFYGPLVALAQQYGLGGEVHPHLDEATICANILSNRLTMPSVNSPVIRFYRDTCPNGKPGGHLVVVFGFSWEEGALTGFYLHNSSGGRPETQREVFVPILRFREAFARRGFSLWAKN